MLGVWRCRTAGEMCVHASIKLLGGLKGLQDDRWRGEEGVLRKLTRSALALTSAWHALSAVASSGRTHALMMGVNLECSVV